MIEFLFYAGKITEKINVLSRPYGNFLILQTNYHPRNAPETGKSQASVETRLYSDL